MSLDKRNQMIGANLRYYRSARGLSLRELASILEVPHSSLARIEKGEGSASKQLLEKVSQVLDIRVEDLKKADIPETLDFLIWYVENTMPTTLVPVLFWLSKSMFGPLREKALVSAMEHSSETDPLYPAICYEMGQYYEGIDREKSLCYYKKAARYSFIG